MENTISKNVESLLIEQLSEWQQAGDNYRNLEKVQYKEMVVNNFPVKVQINPARIVSSAAKVDSAAIQQRKCFLCEEHRPSVQKGVDYTSTSGRNYVVLVNPFPIFPRHLTIPDTSHADQLIDGRYEDMLAFANELQDYVIFYNGPKCGASAPDHMHFQAGNKGFLPLEMEIDSIAKQTIFQTPNTRLSVLQEFVNGSLLIQSSSVQESASYFEKFYKLLETKEGEAEPMLNLLAWKVKETYHTVVILREKHRPSCYFAEGEENILLSPASVDFGGVMITPLEKDFQKISAEDIENIIGEVCVNQEKQEDIYSMFKKELGKYQPQVSVGIMFQKTIEVELESPFTCNGVVVEGKQKFKFADGMILWNKQLYTKLDFIPSDERLSTFELKDVTIGINFHWERKENQKFQGGLSIIVEDEKLTAINKLGVEDYLISVISSEMSATASREFLKSHAVISRSWLLAQMDKNEELEANNKNYCACTETDTERVKWYDREDHTNFVVCADDHCQRYQGITRASTAVVREVVEESWGEVLTYAGKICDARFSKCCGGVVEVFETCWEDVNHPYLVPLRDSKKTTEFPDLTIEAEFEKWVLSSPEALCNTTDAQILGDVLNSYDQETKNFYRWKEVISAEKASELVKKRIGLDFGTITDMIPIQRGPSGRLCKLKIVGTKMTKTIGKELEIRKALSESHLYSSAFIVRKEGDTFELTGAGWGHGAGLCQIGAAVMGAKGYNYNDILLHYFVGADLTIKY